MTDQIYKKTPRLYVTHDLATGESVELSEAQAHYLRNVMRMEAGDHLRIFNGRDGEWLAQAQAVGKRSVIVTVLNVLRPQTASAPLWAVAAPVKKEAFDFMVEKASELGATRFIPVLCDHSAVHRVNLERMAAQAVEAAEQCERLDVMEIAPLQPLKNLLAGWEGAHPLIFCRERGAAPDILTVSRGVQNEPLAVLVGPEGGFSDQEFEYIEKLPFAQAASLGARILRAETALVAALSVVNAVREAATGLAD